MVAVSGTTITVGVFALLAAGGVGIYGILKWANGGEDFPKLDHTNFGFGEWRKDSRNSLVDVNFDFNGPGAIFEVGLFAIVALLVLICCCCGCNWYHGCCYTPKCIRDRQRKKKQEERQKRIRKRKLQEEQEMVIKERRRRKYLRRQREFERRVAEGHPRTRGYTEEQRREILEAGRKREEELAKEYNVEETDTGFNVEEADTGFNVEEADTGFESGTPGIMDAGSPDMSIILPRGSVDSTSSGSTLWAVREGSDMFSPLSRLSTIGGTIVNIENEE